MKYKKGDILVCSTNRTTTTGYNLTVGDKYEIITNPEDWNNNPNDFSKIFFLWQNADSVYALGVKNIKTGQLHKWVPDKLFIPLDVYREFQLKNILDNESEN